MVIQTPTKFFLVSGASQGFSSLNAFDGALLKSGVGDTNLIRLSSILPPYCKQIDVLTLPYGALVPVAYAMMTSGIKNEVISSAVAIGIPENEELAGLIMEFSTRESQSYVEDKVIQMVEQGMRTRDRKIKEIKSISSTIKVEQFGATFAGVVLWD
jgi:arginine decarboxylase